MSLNKACLIGNVGGDPEIRSMQSGDRVANLSIATSEKWKDKQGGEKKERTEWHRIVVWGGLVDVVERYVKKGMKLYVEGQIQTRKWQKDGVDHYSTEIVLRGFGAVLEMLTFADDGDSDQGRSGGGYSGGNQSRHQRPAEQGGGFNGGAGGREEFSADLDDEIPF